jgi:magnesium transporter
MFLGKRFVVTFQHSLGDCFDPLRERIRQAQATVRQAGPDYLAYALLDAVVDAYFPALEKFDDEVRSLEDTIISSPDDGLISRIHDVRNKLLVLRRAVWPLRDALHVLEREPTQLIRDETRVYLRDCADHTFQIMDLVEAYRELTSNLMALYHSSLSNRMNEVMQVLTVIATIFIPLTFIVGVYGMNFGGHSPWAMPELEWYWGYPAVWVVMIIIAAGLLLYFRRKKWLPHERTRPGPRQRADDTGVTLK